MGQKVGGGVSETSSNSSSSSSSSSTSGPGQLNLEVGQLWRLLSPEPWESNETKVRDLLDHGRHAGEPAHQHLPTHAAHASHAAHAEDSCKEKDVITGQSKEEL